MMHVLIVEDDYLQADWLGQILRDQLSGVEIELIRNEQRFYDWLESLKSSPPDLVILDVMLRWTDPGSGISAPEEVMKGGYYRAGLRCEKLLRQKERTRSTPVILYTVLEALDLAAETDGISDKSIYLGKSSNASPLIDVVQKLISR
jgi:CheY-like chemotaxis protein